MNEVNFASAATALQLAPSEKKLRGNSGEVDIRATQPREEVLLLFLEVILRIVREHPHESLVVLVRRATLLEAGDEDLYARVLGTRIANQFAVLLERLTGRRIEDVLFDLRVQPQCSADLIGDRGPAHDVRRFELI